MVETTNNLSLICYTYNINPWPEVYTLHIGEGFILRTK